MTKQQHDALRAGADTLRWVLAIIHREFCGKVSGVGCDDCPVCKGMYEKAYAMDGVLHELLAEVKP